VPLSSGAPVKVPLPAIDALPVLSLSSVASLGSDEDGDNEELASWSPFASTKDGVLGSACIITDVRNDDEAPVEPTLASLLLLVLLETRKTGTRGSGWPP
jgi:hypothetical protein